MAVAMAVLMVLMAVAFCRLMVVVMAVLMRLMAVAFCQLMAMLMTMVFCRLMTMAVPMIPMAMTMSVSISVPVLISILLQMDIKVVSVNSAFQLSPEMEMIPADAHTLQCPLQPGAVGSQIEEGSYGHIAADSRIAFQV